MSAAPSITNRSAIVNGTRLLPRGLDARSARGRRWKEVHRSLVEATGGEDSLTESRRALIRRCASLVVLGEDLDARIVAGDVVDPLEVVRVSGQLSRTLRELGLLKNGDAGDEDETPSLSDYIASKAGAP
jgi:hypothetical protein